MMLKPEIRFIVYILDCSFHVVALFQSRSVKYKALRATGFWTKVVYDTEGGTDIGIAEKRVAHLCNIEFPRIVGRDDLFGIPIGNGC